MLLYVLEKKKKKEHSIYWAELFAAYRSLELNKNEKVENAQNCLYLQQQQQQ